jgi:RNA methyltransferase, TrmH family
LRASRIEARNTNEYEHFQAFLLDDAHRTASFILYAYPHVTEPAFMKTIRSRDNAFVKGLVALAHQSRERKKQQRSVLDGAHLVGAFLDSGRALETLVIGESALESLDASRLMTQLEQGAQQTEIIVLADALMADASILDSPASVIGVAATPVAEPVPPNASAVLVLDNLQDPGNVGSLLRSAAAANVQHVVLGQGTAFAWSPKVLRAGQGAHFAVNIVEGVDIANFLQTFRGVSLALVPAGDGAQSLYDADHVKLTSSVALVVGNEGAGLSADVIAACTQKVTIPMPGRMESLNAAACGAVALFEMVRQRSTAHRVTVGATKKVSKEGA